MISLYNDKCILHDICNGSGSDACHDLCRPFSRLDYMLRVDKSGIPESMQKRIQLNLSGLSDDDKFAITHVLRNTKDMVDKGKCLYLYGSTGTGKTSLAVKIALNYLIDVAYSNDNIDNVCKFVIVSEFVDHIQRNRFESDTDIIDNINDCKLLVLDDIFSYEYKQGASEILDRTIRHRVHNGLSTIYTSNVPCSDIQSGRLSSLIQSSCYPIFVKGIDHRAIQQTAQDFINSFGGAQ